ncbi:hypothetical protein BDA99DRAFT_532992 [Phascolomyces articulosus]|uniref:Uncharacterized protein n=1 Tax=Phascolomyces articulosus TaxID=60185 RepID=A0AAD5PHJ3_9FUNG|nr:hypothetical protein BDA99DRAFT_532992 [Phascolomyces articulosus]
MERMVRVAEDNFSKFIQGFFYKSYGGLFEPVILTCSVLIGVFYIKILLESQERFCCCFLLGYHLQGSSTTDFAWTWHNFIRPTVTTTAPDQLMIFGCQTEYLPTFW